MRKLLTEEEKREKARLKTKRRMADPVKRAKHYAAKNEARRKRWAEKAAAEGREVRKWRYTPEEKKASRKASSLKYRIENAEEIRIRDARIHREIRATEEGAARCAEVAKRSIKKNRHKHRETFATNSRNRRARVRKVGGKHTAADIAELLKRQKGKCAWCLLSLGESKYHVDHYLPISKGGSNDKGNLRILHARCNLRKNAKHPVDFAQQNGLLCW